MILLRFLITKKSKNGIKEIELILTSFAERAHAALHKEYD
jgi:succinate dehydrogenase flavin-adding protein (antitoxin of CptAB toxin-antitoxin module)